MARKTYLTAILPDGYVKTIGPTSAPFTHYWRIVALLANGRTEVFWGHSTSLADAKRKRTATIEAAAQRQWQSYAFEIAELVRHAEPAPPPSGRSRASP